MGRTKRSAQLDSRNKRLDLPLGERKTETLGEGRYLLYKRPLNGAAGNWLARWYDTTTKEFRQKMIGVADDYLDADGIKVLTYGQAQKAAEVPFLEWTQAALVRAGGEVPLTGPFTLDDAWAAYIADAEVRGVHGIVIMCSSYDAHVRNFVFKDKDGAGPRLGGFDVAKLPTAKLREWHSALSQQGRIVTGKWKVKPSEVRHGPAPKTEEEKRARKSTANRVLTNLKSALIFVQQTKGIGRGTNWEEAKPFQNVEAARLRFLTVDEQTRLVNACEPEFRSLVRGALYTGARYGELTKVQVRDFNPDNGTLFIQFGKGKYGYKARHIDLTAEGVAWFTSHTAGRRGTELMFQRTAVARAGRKESLAGFDGWAQYDEDSAMRKAYKAAKIDKVTFHELRHTYASGLVNKGVPLAFVAKQLGHSDTRMVEKHYGHLCPSAKADSIRLLAPVLGISGDLKIQPLQTVAG